VPRVLRRGQIDLVASLLALLGPDSCLSCAPHLREPATRSASMAIVKHRQMGSGADSHLRYICSQLVKPMNYTHICFPLFVSKTVCTGHLLRFSNTMFNVGRFLSDGRRGVRSTASCREWELNNNTAKFGPWAALEAQPMDTREAFWSRSRVCGPHWQSILDSGISCVPVRLSWCYVASSDEARPVTRGAL